MILALHNSSNLCHCRCDGFDPKNHWFHPKTGEGVGFRLNKRTCQEQRHQGEIESYCKVDCDVDGFCTETVKQRKCECPSSRNEESRLEEKCITAAFRVKDGHFISNLFSSKILIFD